MTWPQFDGTIWCSSTPAAWCFTVSFWEDGDVLNKQGKLLTRKHVDVHFFSVLMALAFIMLLGRTGRRLKKSIFIYMTHNFAKACKEMQAGALFWDTRIDSTWILWDHYEIIMGSMSLLSIKYGLLEAMDHRKFGDFPSDWWYRW